jgi:hypothetical protein
MTGLPSIPRSFVFVACIRVALPAATMTAMFSKRALLFLKPFGKKTEIPSLKG